MTGTQRSAWRRLRRRPDFLLAFGFIAAIALVALLAPWIAPYDPMKQDLRAMLAPRSSSHWLGADQYGRDVLSRLIHGARVAIQASLQAVAISALLGIPIGLFVGYKGGRWDQVTMRVVEAVVSLPSVIMAITVLAVLGPGLTNAMIAIGIIYAMSYLRLARGLALSVREELFIDAARVFGLPVRKILFTHILPNVAPPLIVQTTLVFGAALLAEAALSFLGLGVQPPQASWGGMLSDATAFLSQRPFLAIPPGLVIALTVLAFNVLGDAIRDSIGRGVDGASLERATTMAMEGSCPDGEGAAGFGTEGLNIDLRQRTRVGAKRAVDAVDVAIDRSPDARSGQVLEIEGLCVAFNLADVGRLDVVTGVDLVIRAGESVGLVGESGCGKTVTAMSVLGLLPGNAHVSARRLQVDGVSILGASDRTMRSIRGGRASMIFQDPLNSLNPVYTVGDQLIEAIRLHAATPKKEARRRAVELLERVRIPHAARRMSSYPHELSGGMAQRVMIAMALSTEPRLLIADEPTTALDVTVQGQVLDLLRELQEETHMGILFITHDLGVVADICDRAAVMYAGEIVEVNAIENIYRSAMHPYTQRLLASRPDNAEDDRPLPTIPGVVPPPGSWGLGCRFAERCELRAEGCEERQELRSVETGGMVRCHRAEVHRSTEVSW